MFFLFVLLYSMGYLATSLLMGQFVGTKSWTDEVLLLLFWPLIVFAIFVLALFKITGTK